MGLEQTKLREWAVWRTAGMDKIAWRHIIMDDTSSVCPRQPTQSSTHYRSRHADCRTHRMATGLCSDDADDDDDKRANITNRP